MNKLVLGHSLFDLSAPSSVERAIFIVSIFLGHPVDNDIQKKLISRNVYNDIHILRQL